MKTWKNLMELCHISRRIVKVLTRSYVNVALLVIFSQNRAHFRHHLERSSSSSISVSGLLRKLEDAMITSKIDLIVSFENISLVI